LDLIFSHSPEYKTYRNFSNREFNDTTDYILVEYYAEGYCTITDIDIFVWSEKENYLKFRYNSGCGNVSWERSKNEFNQAIKDDLLKFFKSPQLDGKTEERYILTHFKKSKTDVYLGLFLTDMTSQKLKNLISGNKL